MESVIYVMTDLSLTFQIINNVFPSVVTMLT